MYEQPQAEDNLHYQFSFTIAKMEHLPLWTSDQVLETGLTRYCPGNFEENKCERNARSPGRAYKVSEGNGNNIRSKNGANHVKVGQETSYIS